ncbi:MAG: hypothetical protein IPG50_10475 [Myxococcales bacterium]|nr:hypothetical protein [Myxococcales bacterium]
MTSLLLSPKTTTFAGYADADADGAVALPDPVSLGNDTWHVLWLRAFAP